MIFCSRVGQYIGQLILAYRRYIRISIYVIIIMIIFYKIGFKEHSAD